MSSKTPAGDRIIEYRTDRIIAAGGRLREAYPMADKQPETMDSFSDLIDEQFDAFKKGFNPGEQVTGTVTDIGPDSVLLDLHAKQEGVLPRSEIEEKRGEPELAVGDTLTAYFVGMRDGAFLLSLSLAGAAVHQGLREAVEKEMPIEGTVKAEIKGGYEITVGGERAFCPYSQIDLHRKEPKDYIGRKMQFMVTEFDEEEKNIVLSHRELLERERRAAKEELIETLAEGDLRDGVVSRIADFGVFVDLGGIDGLVPLRELTWDRTAKPEDIVSVGEQVQVVVQSIDWEQNRISLSLRYAAGDPWEGAAVRYPAGTAARASVTKVTSFGAFAQLEPGVEGLIHISKLGSGQRIQHARSVLSEGQELDVEVESVDMERRRIALKPLARDEQQAEAETNVQSYLDRGRSSKGLGSLGDALEGLDLPGGGGDVD